MRALVKFAVAMVAIGVVGGQSARAEDFIPSGEEKFKFVAGGVLAWINSSVGVDGTASAGTEIDLDSPTGEKSANNFILGATWRMAPRHRLSGLFYATSKQRALSFNQSITIEDDTLVPPTTLDSNAKNRFIFANYQYSFVKNEDVEIAGLLGAYINKFTIDLTGNASVRNTNNGVTTTVKRDVAYNPGFTVPLPLIGASIDWFVTPRLTLGGSLSGLKAKIGDVDGSVFVATASAEYMFTRNIGGGLSFMHADLDVDVTKTNFNGALNWQNDNLLAYVTLKF